MFNIIKCEDAVSVAEVASNIIIETAMANRKALFLLATGGTPTLSYQLVPAKSPLDELFLNVKIQKLDEWVGLSNDNPASCDDYLRREVVNPWGINPDNYYGIHGVADDFNQECRHNHERLKEANGADLCVLGIGKNGHIGFNEPGDYLNRYSSLVELSSASKKHQMINGQGHITQGVTTGIVEIMLSKKIVLLVTGKEKAEIFKKFMHSEVTPQLPATMLLMHHNIDVIADMDAMSLL